MRADDSRRRIGYNSNSSQAKQTINRGFNTALDCACRRAPVRHEVIRNIAPLAEQLGAAVTADTMNMRTTNAIAGARALLGEIPAGTKILALGIGARSTSRRWPLQNYAKVTERLAANCRSWSSSPVLSSEWRWSWDLLKQRAIIVSGAGLREVCSSISAATFPSATTAAPRGCGHGLRHLGVSRRRRRRTTTSITHTVAPYGARVASCSPLGPQQPAGHIYKIKGHVPWQSGVTVEEGAVAALKC